jgi:hypothetical protein
MTHITGDRGYPQKMLDEILASFAERNEGVKYRDVYALLESNERERNL